MYLRILCEKMLTIKQLGDPKNCDEFAIRNENAFIDI